MRLHAAGERETDYAVVPCVSPLSWDECAAEWRARESWLRRAMARGTRVLVALEPVTADRLHYPGVGEVPAANLAVGQEIVAGLAEYSPVEEAPHPVSGSGYAFLDCLWVIPPFWQRGVGTLLVGEFLRATRGFAGQAVIAYEGDRWLGHFDYMPARFFARFGFAEVDREGTRVLMARPNRDGRSAPPRLLRASAPPRAPEAAAVVDFFWTCQCPWAPRVLRDLNRRLRDTPGVLLRTTETSARQDVERYGMSFGAFVHGRLVRNGAVSCEEIIEAVNQALGSGGNPRA